MNLLPDLSDEKIVSTIALGVRALIVKNLPSSHQAEFETLAQTASDEEILAFGKKNILSFDKKLSLLLDRIYAAAKPSHV